MTVAPSPLYRRHCTVAIVPSPLYRRHCTVAVDDIQQYVAILCRVNDGGDATYDA